MKNVFAISLILVALVECTMTDALQSSDIVRFKAISHRVNEFVDIGDKYYSIQLATELSEKADKIDCSQLKGKSATIEEEFYYYNVLKVGNCKASLPKSASEVIEKMNSLVDVNFALQFPKVNMDAIKVATWAFNSLSACSSLSCSALSFREKVAAISIINRLYDMIPIANKQQVKNYQVIAQNLLTALADEKFVVSDASVISIAELTLFAAAHDLLNENLIASTTAHLMQFHTTTRPEIAFALLRVGRIMAPLATPYVTSIHAHYSAEGEVVLRVTDILDKPMSNLSISLRKDTEQSVVAEYMKDLYVAKMNLEAGYHDLLVKVRRDEKVQTYTLSVLAPMTMQIPSFTTTVKGDTTTYKLPKEQAQITLQPKEFLTLHVNAKIPTDFIPTTIILQIVEKATKKSFSLPMRRAENGFVVELTPSRSDLGSLVAYQDGVFSMFFLCGDKLFQKAVKMELGTVELHFGGKPKDPIYPIYSKPLMYATEQSLAAMKEIEHKFQPENRNPFVLFPLGFAALVVVALVGLVMMWGRLGIQMKKEDMSKKIAKCIFVGCIAVVVSLYANFWFRGNMASLLKQLVPVVIITLIAGNRAL